VITQPTAPAILEFSGDYRFLSNFYKAELVWDNIVWPSSEHAYQAAKVLDREKRLELSRIKNPAMIKKMGKGLDLRDDWEQVKYDTMLEIVRAKFTQNPELKAKLLATGNAHLEEGNTWRDKTWGVCPPGSGEGLNYLGKILMTVREELR
jgi:ribA/ribD-fused uncharacterized protein